MISSSLQISARQLLWYQELQNVISEEQNEIKLYDTIPISSHQGHCSITITNKTQTYNIKVKFSHPATTQVTVPGSVVVLWSSALSLCCAPLPTPRGKMGQTAGLLVVF